MFEVERLDWTVHRNVLSDRTTHSVCMVVRETISSLTCNVFVNSISV
jgi:hypothetical protein